MKNDVWAQMFEVIRTRRENPEEGSYTCYLFEKGRDKILKKIGEEAAETIIAAKNPSGEDLVGEINDLFYHVLVLAAEYGLTYEEIAAECEKRAEKIGNLKKMKTVDRNT